MKKKWKTLLIFIATEQIRKAWVVLNIKMKYHEGDFPMKAYCNVNDVMYDVVLGTKICLVYSWL